MCMCATCVMCVCVIMCMCDVCMNVHVCNRCDVCVCALVSFPDPSHRKEVSGRIAISE